MALYTLAPNGDFEDGLTGWTVTGDARSWHRFPRQDRQAGRRPAGARAAPRLVRDLAADLRRVRAIPARGMFGHTVRRNPASGSTLQVEVLYIDRGARRPEREEARQCARRARLGRHPQVVARAGPAQPQARQHRQHVHPVSLHTALQARRGGSTTSTSTRVCAPDASLRTRTPPTDGPRQRRGARSPAPRHRLTRGEWSRTSSAATGWAASHGSRLRRQRALSSTPARRCRLPLIPTAPAAPRPPRFRRDHRWRPSAAATSRDVLASWPVAGELVGMLSPPLRCVVLPLAIAALASLVAPDGRSAHCFTGDWLRFRGRRAGIWRDAWSSWRVSRCAGTAS